MEAVSPVAEHFNLPDNNNIRDMRVSVVRQVKGGTATRQREERRLIFKFKRLEPSGMKLKSFPQIKFNVRFLSNFHKLLSIVQCFEIYNKKNRSLCPFRTCVRLTNTCLFDQFTLLSVGRGSTQLKQS